MMTGEGVQGGVESVFAGCAGGQAVAANGILVCMEPET